MADRFLRGPAPPVQDATHFRRTTDPQTGKEVLEPCSPGEEGAFPATLQVRGWAVGGWVGGWAAGRRHHMSAEAALVVQSGVGACLVGRQRHLFITPRLCPPCHPQTLADKGLAGMVHPPKITFRDFEKVCWRRCSAQQPVPVCRLHAPQNAHAR